MDDEMYIDSNDIFLKINFYEHYYSTPSLID